MRRTHAMAVLALPLIAMSFAGCGLTPNAADIEAFKKPYEVNVTAENYILQPPDEIEVHCTKVPEIHLQRQRIRPDGKVSFEALGEIEVAGKTIAEAADLLEKRAAELYTLAGEHPIDVRVDLYLSKVYYVLGQVNSPGPKVYTGRDTTLGALAAAQPNVLAWERRVQVVRPSSDKQVEPKIFEVNFLSMSRNGDTSKDVLLEEGDIVYVPATIFAAISMKIEEVIRPIARAFSGAYILQAGPSREAAYYGRRGY